MATETAQRDAMRRQETYRAPDRYCDIVMKGGITSGVIYPSAVCEIARTYQLRSIGGASAGAIAAVASAAAEYGRTSSTGGFARLAALPEWLGDSSNLYDLFQPQEGTRRLYRLFTAPIGAKSGRINRLLGTALEQFVGWALLGLVPGAFGLAVGLVLSHGVARGMWVGAAIPSMLLGAFIGVVLGIYRATGRGIPANRFGLCSGMPAPSADVPSLTPWLDRLIEEIAGRDPGGTRPLTFGDLWSGPAGVGRPPEDQAGEPWIRLEMMTTNLTQGRPYRLPFETKEWYFDPAEFRQLFPERIVRWMERHPPALPTKKRDRAWAILERKLLDPLRPLPDPADLPVVLAARLSLSFPLLISAVPLHSVDWTRISNRQAKKRWEAWAGQLADGWEYLRPASLAWDRLVEEVGPGPRATVSWFSDGGITSNFPVHFFDAPIPRWPTFAINLRDYHPDYPPTCDRCNEGEACDEHQSVWMPRRNQDAIREGYREFAPRGLRALVGFGHSIVDTMQNWTDNTQTRVPGYRDRVVHVRHTKEEGGLNLSMPACRIEALAERGRCAAEELVERFKLPPDPKRVLTWDNHRWVRYRTTMALLQESILRVERAWRGSPVEGFPLHPPQHEISYGKLLWKGRNHAPSYQLGRQYPFAEVGTHLLLLLARSWHAGDFGYEAPRPRPELRVRPKV